MHGSRGLRLPCFFALFGQGRKGFPFLRGAGRASIAARLMDTQRFSESVLTAKTEINGATVFAGRGILPSLPVTVALLVECGRVLVVFDEEGKECAERVAGELKNYGYRVTLKDAAHADEAEECCRLSVGVGGFSACESAGRAARSLGAECVLVPVSPCEDRLLRHGGVSQVYVDGEVLDACSPEQRAAGLGLYYSMPVRRFEDYYRHKVLARPALARDDPDPECERDSVALLLYLLKEGAKSDDRYACDIAAELMAKAAANAGKKPRLRGEYCFVAACTLAVFYSSFLSSPAIDTLLPADHAAAAGKIAAVRGCDAANGIELVDFFSVNEYFRISYVLGEYRLDLFDKLAVGDMRSVERRWRRLYDDAGYWLKSALTARDVLGAIALAGEECEGLLAYITATGFCEGMTAREN